MAAIAAPKIDVRSFEYEHPRTLIVSAHGRNQSRVAPPMTTTSQDQLNSWLIVVSNPRLTINTP